MRGTSSVATLIAVLMVAFAAKYERAMVTIASNTPAISMMETEHAASILLAQFNPCPTGIASIDVPPGEARYLCSRRRS